MLCRKVLVMQHVVNPVVKIVYFIRAKGLNHRQFKTLFEISDSDHNDIPYHTDVRWLSLGKVLELKSQIRHFSKIKSKPNNFLFEYTEWFLYFALIDDLFGHMNELSTKLLGKDTFAHELYFVVTACRLELKLFSHHLNENNFTHFKLFFLLESLSN